MRRSLDKGDMEYERIENQSARWLSLGVRATGGISAILGFVVLVGWYTHNAFLIQVMPIFVPMQFNTALGFLLCGVGLLSVEFRRSSLAVACGALVGAVGLLTLIQYVFGSDFGIDQLLMEHYITVETSHPGRMAPNTALSFLLTGTALLIMAWPTRHNRRAIITGLLGATITTLGVVAFSGYLSGIESAYGWGYFTRMAVHTAFGFAVLGLGVLALAWREGTAEDGSLPKWSPVSAVTASAIILLGMLSWWAMARVTAEVRVETGEALSAVLETTQQALRSWYRANRAVAQSWGGSARLERLTQKLLATPPTREALLNAQAQVEIREWLRPVYSREEYQGFFIIGPRNISLASMRDSNVGVLNLLSNQEDILEKMWSGQTVLSLPQRSDVPLTDEFGMLREGMPTMFVGSPIRDESGAVIAIFTLRINPSKEFTAILQRGRIGETGETYAFDGRARLVSESRYDDQLRDIGLIGPGERGILNVTIRDPGVNLVAGEVTTTAREQQPLTHMAARAVAGESGTDVKGYRDYRGVSVFGSWVWDSDLGFGIVTEIDTSEAYGPLVSIQTIILALTVFSMLLLLAVTAVFMASHKRVLQNENRTRTILETALDAVIGADDSGTITHWNSQAEQTFGWSREEAVGRRLTDTILPRKYREAHERGLRHFLTTGEGPVLNKRLETSALHQDGHELPIELTITPFRVGANYMFNAFARDITERKQMEEQLRKLSSAVEQTADPVVITDANGVIQYANSAFEKTTGYTAQEVIGKKPRILKSGHHQKQFYKQLWDTILAGKVWQGTFVNRRKNRELYFAESSISPIISPDGALTHFVSVERDITERKQAEEELRRLNEELESRVEMRTSALKAANKELEAFSYSVAHDLRAPLRQIDGFSNILAEDLGSKLDHSVKDSLEEIRGGVKKMGSLIDDLLNLSRVGRQKLHLQVTGFNSLVEKVVGELKPETRDRQIEWKIGRLPFIECDANLLEQVFFNLLSNAVKYTRPRERAVIEVAQMTQDDQPVVFVRDNGVGFNMKHANKLFGIFQRLHRQEDFDGTGVGLATVQRIIHKHGGQVWAEAELDKGAAFFFTLGIHKSEETINEEGGKQ